MIDVLIKMTVSADKRDEVLHTIKNLLMRIRREKDCVSCHCYLDAEAEDLVILEQEWNSKEALMTHLRSGHFKVLLGVMQMLTIEPDIRFNTVIATEGMEIVSVARTC